MFTVTDGNLSTSQSVVFAIANATQPVTLNPFPAEVLAAGQKLVLLPQTTSAPGASLTFTADALPFGASLNETTGQFVWTPAYNETGDYSFNLSVTDGNTTATQPVNLTVDYANTPPVFEGVGPYQVYDGQSLGFLAFAFDPNNPDYEPPLQNPDGTLTQQTNLPATSRWRRSARCRRAPRSTRTRLNSPGSRRSARSARRRSPSWRRKSPASPDQRCHRPSPSRSPCCRCCSRRRSQPISDYSIGETGPAASTSSAIDPQGRALTLSLANDAQGYPVPSFITLTDNGNGTGHDHGRTRCRAMPATRRSI